MVFAKAPSIASSDIEPGASSTLNVIEGTFIDASTQDVGVRDCRTRSPDCSSGPTTTEEAPRSNEDSYPNNNVTSRRSFTLPHRRSRRTFALFGGRFQCAAQNMQSFLDVILTLCTFFVEKIVLFLGPLLICFAAVIIAALSHTFFTIIVPMLHHLYAPEVDGKRKSTEDLNFFFKFAASALQHPYSRELIVMLHICVVVFLLVNIVFNYFMCVTTRNKGKNYDLVVRELALATNFHFPESQSQLDQFRREYENRMLLRVRGRQTREQPGEERLPLQQEGDADLESPLTHIPGGFAGKKAGRNANFDVKICSDNKGVTLRKNTALSSSPSQLKRAKQHLPTTYKGKNRFPVKSKTPSPKLIRNWMLMAPDEWGYCSRSHQAKPPRSHYDYVTKTLVLCLDHYCPWMFNAIGYFNYRYFCNFLWFVELAMIYGVCVTMIPFQNLSTVTYKNQIRHYRQAGSWKRLHPMTPFPHERMAISLSFMLCLAVGLAVFCLAIFHLYLILTGQTTIEFHGNWVARKKFNQEQRSLHSRGGTLKKWANPYDMGWQRNWQQIYGTGNPFWAVTIPSTRQPEFLPLPLPGEIGRRRKSREKKKNSPDDEEVILTKVPPL